MTSPAHDAEGTRGLREAVEALLTDGPESWTPYESRDTGLTFLAESVLDFVADLRALLAAHPPEPEASEVVAAVLRAVRVANEHVGWRAMGVEG